jgi:hypothetical protein
MLALAFLTVTAATEHVPASHFPHGRIRHFADARHRRAVPG